MKIFQQKEHRNHKRLLNKPECVICSCNAQAQFRVWQTHIGMLGCYIVIYNVKIHWAANYTQTKNP